MGQVIYHDFSSKSCLPFPQQCSFDEISEAEAFVIRLATDLEEQDFWDFVEAVNDPGLYDHLDKDLKSLVDTFWSLKTG